MFKKKILKEELRKLPLYAFPGNIYVIDTVEAFYKIITKLQSFDRFGFDTETRPSFRKGRNNKVALLQLSTKDEAFLFRLNKIGLPEDLKDILADTNVKKIGVAIHDDIKALRKLNEFDPNGFIELQHYVKDFGIENFGLKKLAGIVLNIRISKSKQLSNWENQRLSDSQLRYAATDAWAPYMIYNKLNNSNKEKSP